MQVNHSLRDLWQLSNSVYKELFFRTKLISASPARKAEMLDKLEENTRSEKRAALILTVFYTMMLVIMNLLPVFTLDRLVNYEEVYTHAMIYVYSLTLGLYTLQITIISFMFLKDNLLQFMKGDVFGLLQGLPISRRDSQLIALFTFLRIIYIPMLAVLLVYPVVGLAISASLKVFVMLLFFTLTLVVFSQAIVIIVINFVSERNRRNPDNPALANAVNFVGIVLYLVIVLPVYFAMSTVMGYFESVVTSGAIDPTVNTILAAVPFPFSPGYAVTMVIYGGMDQNLLISTIAGTVVYVLMLFLLVSKALKALRTQILGRSTTIEPIAKQVEIKDIQIRAQGATRSLLGTTLKLVGRDSGSFGYFILGIIFPVMFLATAVSYELDIYDFLVGFYVYMVTFLLTFTPNFLVEALSFMEEGLGGVLAGLPVRMRSIFRSKQIIMVVATEIALLILLGIGLALEPAGTPFNQSIVMLVIHLSFTNIIAMSSYLILNSLFFGKLNNRYTFEKVQIQKKIRKYVAISTILYVIVFSHMVLIDLFSGLFANMTLVYTISISLIYITILELVARKLFD